jgi:hypothetical protein
VAPDELEAIVASNLRDIDQLAGSMPGEDVVSPARRRMRQFMQRSPCGVMPSAIVKLLEAEKMPVTRQTRAAVAARGRGRRTGRAGRQVRHVEVARRRVTPGVALTVA